MESTQTPGVGVKIDQQPPYNFKIFQVNFSENVFLILNASVVILCLQIKLLFFIFVVVTMEFITERNLRSAFL